MTLLTPMRTYNAHVTDDSIPNEDAVEIGFDEASGLSVLALAAFNTTITAKTYCEGGAAYTAFQEVVDACRFFERLFSRTLPHSDISRLNGSCGRWVEVSRDTFTLLQASVHYCAVSEGTFDISMGAATRLWDFARGAVPSEESLRTALRHVDYRFLELAEDGERALARLTDECATVDVGGTAKGYIADALAQLLIERNIDSFVVNLGGNVYARGRKPDGKPWTIGVRNPRIPGNVLGTVALQDMAAVTSGTYERCFEHEGVRYHHILDTATGLPVETDAEGVTVLARSAMDAEGYSTTLLALGIERGIAFITRHPEIHQAFFVNKSNEVIPARNNR